MKRLERKVWLGGVVLLLAAVSAGHVCAASLTNSAPVRISSGSDCKISVYAGKSAYTGQASSVLGDGTVLAYRFYNSATRDSGGYTNSGNRISDITYAGTTSETESERADVWTVTDPGALTAGIPAFSSTADFGGTTETIASIRGVNGTVDITRLVTGTVYVLVGGYQSELTVSLSMTGPSQTSINATTVSATTSLARNLYVFAFQFDNPDGLYNLISYSFTHTSASSQSVRGRFMGVLLDGQPPPAGTVLIIR